MIRRIAYICADPGVPVFGAKGCSIHVQEVIRAMCKRGITLDLFATRFDGPIPAGLENVRVHQLPPAPKGDLATRERLCLANNDDLRAALDATREPFDLVYQRYSLWSDAAITWAASRGVPSVVEVNAPLIDEQSQHRGLVDRSTAEQIAHHVFSQATGIASVSDEVANWVSDRFPLARGRVHVIPNGVDAERFCPHVEPIHGSKPGTMMIGFVGTLKQWHGLDFLIDVFARLHARDDTWRLMLIGDGPLREQLELNARERNLTDAITFTGMVPSSRMPGMLASIDIAVAPYPRLDRFYFSPMKLFEYMAAALPIVGSAIGQVEQVIQDGVSGILCPPGDADRWGDALTALRGSASLRWSLGHVARSAAIANHSWDSVVSRILSIAVTRKSEPAEVPA